MKFICDYCDQVVEPGKSAYLLKEVEVRRGKMTEVLDAKICSAQCMAHIAIETMAEEDDSDE